MLRRFGKTGWIFLVVFAILIYYGVVYFSPLFQDQVEDVPFVIDAKIVIDEGAIVGMDLPCVTVEACGLLGDEVAYQLFDLESESPWAGALLEMKSFDAVLGDDGSDNIEDESAEDMMIEESGEVSGEEEDAVWERGEDNENKESSIIAQYEVEGDELKSLEYEDVSLEQKALIEGIRGYFTFLIPQERRSQLSFFLVHDGSDLAAYIDASGAGDFWNPGWYDTLGVDIANIWKGEPFDTLTLIHEFAHLFSLSRGQYGHLLACESTWLYGCHLPWSYLQNFAYQFWRNVDKDWIDKSEYSAEDNLRFYKLNAQSFINSYAAGSPDEDFAESFTAFIVTPRYELDATNPIDQKQLFFYQYPELVGLRLHILQKLMEVWTMGEGAKFDVV